MKKDFINEHIDDSSHVENIELDLDKVLEEREQFKKLVDLFMLALVLIFAMYAIF